jgi:hypothetical protein
MVALITEALWETIKLAKNPKGLNIDKIGVMLLGILIAVASGIDLFSITGTGLKVPFLGSVLTGLLISRGSNFVHDIMGSMGHVYQNQKTVSRSGDTKKIN